MQARVVDIQRWLQDRTKCALNIPSEIPLILILILSRNVWLSFFFLVILVIIFFFFLVPPIV